MTKRGVETQVFALLKSSKQPITTRDIALRLNLAWHTADRYCLKLQIKEKIACFTIGKATAWYSK